MLVDFKDKCPLKIYKMDIKIHVNPNHGLTTSVGCQHFEVVSTA